MPALVRDVPFWIVIGTVPIPGGVVTVIDVPELSIEIFVPEALPNVTVEPFSNPAPVMVTVVPPVAGPVVGVTDFTVVR